MNSCRQCGTRECTQIGKEGDGSICPSWNLRILNTFEKSIIRHGLICGLIIGFFMGLSIFFSLHLAGVIP